MVFGCRRSLLHLQSYTHAFCAPSIRFITFHHCCRLKVTMSFLEQSTSLSTKSSFISSHPNILFYLAISIYHTIHQPSSLHSPYLTAHSHGSLPSKVAFGIRPNSSTPTPLPDIPPIPQPPKQKHKKSTAYNSAASTTIFLLITFYLMRV